MEFSVELPERKPRGRTDWLAVVEQCQKHRGMYGLVGEFSVSMASQVRRGSVPAFLPRSGMDDAEKVAWMEMNWQVEYRTREDTAPGRADLYVRYIG